MYSPEEAFNSEDVSTEEPISGPAWQQQRRPVAALSVTTVRLQSNLCFVRL